MKNRQSAASVLALAALLCGALAGCSHSAEQENAQVKSDWDAHRKPPPGFAEKMAAQRQKAQQSSGPAAGKSQ